eukprot:gene3125-4916_t
MVEAPTTGKRAFMNLGGGDELNGMEGFWFGYRNGQLFAKFKGFTGFFIDSDWHHYAATYTGRTLRVYFDEQEVATVDIALDLVESSKYSTMMIGETHFGKTNIARDGVWLFDEAVFGRGVVGFFDVLRAPCLRTEVFSRYPLDGDFLDTALAGNSLAATFTPANDSVCGGSLRVEEGEFFAFQNPNGVPTGSESCTVSIYAKMLETPTAGSRALMNLGGDGYKGFSFGYHNDQLAVKFADITGIFLDSDWHHYAATYNGSTLTFYFDEREVATVDIDLDLVKSSELSTMMIGETQFGSTSVARDGVWLFDEAVFGRGVLGFDVLRAPCVPNAPVVS